MRPVLHAITFAVLAVVVSGCGTLAGGRSSTIASPTVVGMASDPGSATPSSAAVDPSTPVRDEAQATPADDHAAAASTPPVSETPTPAVAAEPPAVDPATTVSSTESTPTAPTDGAIVLASEAAAPAPTYYFVQKKPGDDEYDVEDYDPWEKFNEKMFEFNRRLDRYLLKPVAKAYDKVVPDDVERMLANAFDNITGIPRMINSLLQGKWDGAMREFGRLLLNSTVGVGGLFDVAKHEGIEKSREDFGQTLAFYGAGPGPYLVLPFMEPMTVRDGIGRGVDGVMDPLGWTVSLVPVRLILKVVDVVNERAMNLELFQGFEETVIDMYSAVRHAYLERRRHLISQ